MTVAKTKTKAKNPNQSLFSLPRSRYLSRHATLLPTKLVSGEERCVTRQITAAWETNLCCEGIQVQCPNNSGIEPQHISVTSRTNMRLINMLWPKHYYVVHRGYYMAARRYEISLRVLKNISRVSAANE